MKQNEILRSYGTDYFEMTIRLLQEADLLGAVEEKCGVGNKDARIGIKPNLVNATPAFLGATTHPQVVSGIIFYLQERGYHNLLMMESSWIGGSTGEALAACEYDRISETFHVPFLDLKTDAVQTCAGKDFAMDICECPLSMDFLINVPVLKGHGQTKITCALKNMKGCIPDYEKRRFHKEGLHAPIAHLNSFLKQDFIVVDHICGDPQSEDGGHPLIKDCVMAAKDPVLTDAYVAQLLGYATSEIPYIGMAEQLGVGSADLSKLQVITVEGTPDEEIPVTHRKADLSMAVEQIDSCSTCYAMLADALERLQEEGLLEQLQEMICIGQGYQGKGGVLGVGDCTALFDCSVQGCPPEADDIYAELKSYILHKGSD